MLSRWQLFPYRLSIFGGATAILTYPWSVSISQAGLALALLGWAWWAVTRPQLPDALREQAPELPLLRHPALIAAVAIYVAQLLALLYNAATNSGELGFTAFFARGWRTELKDVFILGMAFWTAAYASTPEGRRNIPRWFTAAVIILVVAGVISIFSKWRLHKLPYHIQHGWEATAAARFQHYLLTVGGVHVYMPIGLTNTHLTYGGMLMLVFPFLTFRVLHVYLERPLALLQWKHLGKIMLLGAAALVFLLNNGRSAILGMLIAVLVGLYWLGITHWGRKILRLLPILLLAVMALFAADRLSSGVHDRFEKIVGSLLGRAKHTDFQRTLVWNGTLTVIADHPVAGVGAGNFSSSIEEHIITFSREQPHLWTAYATAQRGHAHNDMLHFLAIGGPLCLLAYLLFFGLLIHAALAREEAGWWRFGVVALLVAGLFQCYMQDDEVLLPFWALVGWTLGASASSQHRQEQAT